MIDLLPVRMLRRTDYTDPASRVPGDTGNRQWLYQTCTEFGWYQSSDLPDRFWGDIIPVSLFEDMCTDIFGPKFTLDLLEEAVKVNTFICSK